MAGSGLRPLSNIPHCCLPEESGPYLSPNVAGRPLRPATDRRLGEPLPHLQANRTQAHPIARAFKKRPPLLRRDYAALIRVSPGYSPLLGRFLRVTHPFAARQQEQAPLLPLDLHVLSLPPAFNLSHDQTLQLKFGNHHMPATGKPITSKQRKPKAFWFFSRLRD